MKAIKKYYFMAIVFSLGLRAKLLHEARPFILDLEGWTYLKYLGDAELLSKHLTDIGFNWN